MYMEVGQAGGQAAKRRGGKECRWAGRQAGASRPHSRAGQAGFLQNPTASEQYKNAPRYNYTVAKRA